MYAIGSNKRNHDSYIILLLSMHIRVSSIAAKNLGWKCDNNMRGCLYSTPSSRDVVLGEFPFRRTSLTPPDFCR